MERVLLDGTTLMSATRLLTGEDPPTALNVYSLSLLVESLILHTELIVLDTLPDDDRLTQAAAMFGDAVWVERRSTEDIVERYTGLNGLTVEDMNLPPPEEMWSRGLTRQPAERPVEDAAHDLYWLLTERGHFDKQQELGGYLDMLDAAHRKQFERDRSERGDETLPEPSFIRDRGGLRWIGPAQPGAVVTSRPYVRIADRTELRELVAAGSTATALSGFVERHVYSRESLWNHAQSSRETYLTEFTPALLMRTRFYLLASEVFAAPYRPDVLRAPICWKFFDRGPFADLTIDERMVHLAEGAAQARVESVNQFIGRPAFTALPLFLGRVLGSSSRRADIVAKTMQIRESPQARRFRQAISGLAAAEEAGDVSALVRDAARYSDLLRREYGSATGGAGATDVLWSLAADGTKAAFDPTAASLASLGGSVGKTAIRAPDLVRRWSYGRKMALIARTIRAANKAKAMQSELRRLFGAELTPGDVEFLEKVDRLSFD